MTGAARGIGRTFAQAYIYEGATVAIADIDLERAQATAAELGDSAYAVKMDVTDQASIDQAIEAVVAQVGKLDILINNAALFDLAPIVEITRQSYERLFSINVAGTLFTLQAAARQMIRQGHGGRIINMASQAGRRGEALVGVYCATKAAVISLTQSAGLDLIKHRINVNAIAPRRGGWRALGWRGCAVRPPRKPAPGGKRSARSGNRCPMAGWGLRRTSPGWRFSSPRRKASTWWRRPITSMGGNWMS
nr:L-iditol 2-dehydrogenase [Pseudomonas brassicacearum subsp. brassicacearum]